MPLCGLRSQAHLFMCNSKTLASKLLLFKGGSCNNSITSFKLQSLLLCTSLPASHSLFCPELERNDKSKTENKLLESFSNTVIYFAGVKNELVLFHDAFAWCIIDAYDERYFLISFVLLFCKVVPK